MPTLRLTLVAALALLPRAAPSQTVPPPEDRRLAREILAQLVGINTTHDSGQLAGPKPRKQNLVVRLRGNSRGAPVLFLAHLDVVEARREDWSVEPFRLTERDGWLYGRGTSDIKDEAADLVANLIRLKRERYVPSRDIVVALTDDEEGGDANDAAWLLEHRRDLIEARYVINLDAGGGQLQDGRRLRNPVQTSEKVYATTGSRSSDPADTARSPRGTTPSTPSRAGSTGSPASPSRFA